MSIIQSRMQAAALAAAAAMPPARAPPVRAIIIPGNGDGDVRRSNWYTWLEGRLLDHPSFDEVVLRDMPDPLRARRKIWVPFMLDELGADERTVIIGHSSGAVAAMRLLEEHQLHGAVLVASCHTDLGDANERASGYYPPSGGPWRWNEICRNAGGNVRLLHSDNDPFIPLDEAKHVASQLGCALQVESGRSHFFSPCDAIFEAAVAVAQAQARDAS